MNRFKFLSSVVLLILFSIPVFAQSDEAIPGVITVKYLPGFSGQLHPALQAQAAEPTFPILDTPAVRKRALPESMLALKRIHTVHYDADLTPEQASDIMSKQPGVEYAEPIYPRHLAGFKVNDIPNDPGFSNTSYMERMKITEAWEVVKGEEGEVIIAIVDTGTIWELDDLFPNAWTNPNEIPDNGVDDDGNGLIDDYYGWNYATTSDKPAGNWWDEHGTFTASLAAAVADNGQGIAGTSWNAKFMSLGLRGPDGAWAFAEHAMVYASINGADIINASFSGWWVSNRERDVIKGITDSGTLVIAAAGNYVNSRNNYYFREHVHMDQFRHLPAGYPETMSICGVTPDGDLNIFNHGYTVDACAAGDLVTTLSTIGENFPWSGTSAATALVSGVAALVKTKFPHFTAVQIREQLRATSDNIDDVNGKIGLYGRGRINALRAVTEEDAVSVRSTNFKLTDADGDGYYASEEPITVQFTITNHLAPVNGLSIKLRPVVDGEISPHVSVIDPNPIGPMATGDSLTVSANLKISTDMPYKTFLFIEPVITTSDGTVVSGGDAARLIAKDVEFVTHKTDVFALDITSEGDLGFPDAYEDIKRTDYVGVIGENGMLVNGQNILYKGGVLVGNAGRLATTVGTDANRYPFLNQDFEATSRLKYEEDANDVQYTQATYRTRKLRLGITQQTMVDPFFANNIVLLRYIVHNESSRDLDDVHVGFLFDWDAYPDRYWEDTYGYIDADALTYTAGVNGTSFIGVAPLGTSVRKHSRSYNTLELTTGETPHRQEQQWLGLSGGVNLLNEGTQGDWWQLSGVGPHVIPAGERDTVHFALIYARSEASLMADMNAARDLYNEWQASGGVFVNTEDRPAPPTEFVLRGNYPNPFTGSTSISFDLPEPARVSLDVIDMLGRTVRKYPNRDYPAGRSTLKVSGEGLAAGVYLYRLRTGSRTLTGKLNRM